MPRRFLLPIACLLLLLLPGCAPDETGGRGASRDAERQKEKQLNVFAAASLADAFAEIEAAFEAAHPGVDVVLNLAGSQQLAQQLSLGAPADVFASANHQQMQVAVAAGRVMPEAPQTFAQNRLMVVVPADNPAALHRLQELARPGLRLVLAAEAVPVGQYARLFLEKASREDAFGAAYGQRVLANVASFEQNVRAVLTKVALGEADAGIVYESDLAGAMAGDVQHLDIPDALSVPARYPIAPIADSVHPELACTFFRFVRSPTGQQILTRYGFAASHPS